MDHGWKRPGPLPSISPRRISKDTEPYFLQAKDYIEIIEMYRFVTRWIPKKLTSCFSPSQGDNDKGICDGQMEADALVSSANLPDEALPTGRKFFPKKLEDCFRWIFKRGRSAAEGDRDILVDAEVAPPQSLPPANSGSSTEENDICDTKCPIKEDLDYLDNNQPFYNNSRSSEEEDDIWDTRCTFQQDLENMDADPLLHNNFVGAIEQLAVEKMPASRLFACRMLSINYDKVSPSAKYVLRLKLRRLCADEDVDVRTMAMETLVDLARDDCEVHNLCLIPVLQEMFAGDQVNMHVGSEILNLVLNKVLPIFLEQLGITDQELGGIQFEG